MPKPSAFRTFLVTAVLSLLLSLGATIARADHFSGASITYECTGGNMYNVYLDLYLDCAGTAITPQTLNFTNDCGVSFSIANLLYVSEQEVSPLCNAALPNSTCNGGTLPGFRWYRFQTSLFLSPCDSWTISWNICCRNTMENIAGTPGTYVEATLNNTGGLCDDSPVFADSGIPYICLGNDLLYSPGATDPDGNTMVFALIDARFNAPPPTTVNYMPGYTGAEPLPGMTIDPNTGQLNFEPTEQGNYTVVVQVSTYDPAGNLIGTVMRDLMFVAVACNGTPPLTQGLVNVQGGAMITGPNSIEVCDGENFCVDMEFTDEELNNVVSLFSNAVAQLPGATFQVNGSNPAVATLCWTADTTQLPMNVYVQADDGDCPIMNIISTSLLVTAATAPSVAPDAGLDGSVTACSTGPAIGLFPILGGSPDAGGTWTDPDGNAHTGTFTPGTDPFGDYIYTVGSACENATATITVIDDGNGAAGTDGTLTICSSAAAVDLFQSLGGTPAAGGVWVGPIGPMNGTYDPAAHDPGVYIYTLVGGSCPGASATVTVNELISPYAGMDAVVDLCSTSPTTDLFTLLGAAAQPGGSWSGPSAINGNFSPVQHQPGVYTYTVTGDPACASSTASVAVNVNMAPDAGSNANLTICNDGAPVDLIDILNGAPQPGGAWTGPAGPMNGTYDPAILDPGNYAYTIQGTAPCANATAFVIVVETAAPDAGTDASVEVCSNDGPIDLFASLGGTPSANGTWTGPSAITGIYDPAIDVPGDYIYTVTGPGSCTPATATVTVIEPIAPDAGIAGNITVCSDQAVVDLFTVLNGTPQPGGTWTGPDAIDGNFDPAIHAEGIYIYTLTGSGACADVSSTVTVDVVQAANAGNDASIAVCASDAPVDLFALLGVSAQAGGTWSGSSVITGTYDPSIHDPGGYQYSIAGQGNCPGASAIVLVTEGLIAVAGLDGSAGSCSNGQPIDLFTALGGSPQSGGSWSGPSVLAGGIFDPSVHLAGDYSYTVNGGPPCPAATAVVTVSVETAADAGGDAAISICASGAAVDLFATLEGTPQQGGVWAGPSTLNGMYDPALHEPGIYTYSIPAGILCPAASASIAVAEVVSPNAGNDLQVTFCSSDAPVDLFSFFNGSADAGGEWSGPNGTFDGNFDPASDPEGIYSYSIDALAPCVSDQASVAITIHPAPDAGIDGSITVCGNGGQYNLFSSLGGTPQTGGTWTGANGAFDGMYDPSVNAPGTFIYSIDGTAPCGSSSAMVIVNETSSPNAGLDALASFCPSDLPVDLFTLLGGTPDIGGSWTGPSADMTGTFDPAIHAEGLYTYTIEALSPCVSDASTVSVQIEDGADAGQDAAIAVCASGDPVDLFAALGGTPQSGGDWSGPSAGMNGNFDPAVHAPGTYIYTVAGSGNCGAATANVVVSITTDPNAGDDASLSICSNAGTTALFALLGGNPDPNGSWSGPTGVFSGNFDPSIHPAGVYTYTVDATPPCIADQATVTVAVEDAPFAGTDSIIELCPSAAIEDLFALLGTTQSGGSWIGPSAGFTGSFDPALHLPGIYTYTVGSQTCGSASASITVSILPGADAGSDASISLCSTDQPVDLTASLAGTPDPGGIWMNATGDTIPASLDPASGSGGTFTYLVNGSGDCPSAQAQLQVTLSAAPQAGTGGILEMCMNDDQVSLFEGLTGTLDAGGTWTDPNGQPHASLIDPQSDVAGSYTYTVTNGSCPAASSVVNVVIFSMPDAGESSSAAFCTNQSGSALMSLLEGTPDPNGTWTGPDGSPAATMFLPGNSTPGIYTYTVQGNAACGSDISTVTITISEAANAGTDGAITLCQNDAPIDLFTLIGGSPDSNGTWSGPDGSTSNIFDPAIGMSGNYVYSIQPQMPCAAVSSVIVVDVLPVPMPTITATGTDACAPMEVTLSHDHSGSASCTWILGNGMVVQDCGPVTTIYEEAGSYDVTLMIDAGNGCGASTIQAIGLVEVFDRPVAAFDALPEVIGMQDPTAYFHNYSQGANAYLWDMGGTGTYTSEHVNHIFPGQLSEEYEVCLIAYASPQCADTICKVVEVGEALNLHVPNAFSPNGDGINDEFRPIVGGIDPDRYLFMIFDRWGSEIYSTNVPGASWNGLSASGDEIPQGVYPWKLHMKDPYSGDRIERIGHVTLVR